MSKINHNRPSLRYLDSFRREMSAEQQRSHWLERNRVALVQKAMKRTRLELHLEDFEGFTPAVQATLERLIYAFSEAEDAVGDVISTITNGSKGRRKSAEARRDETHEELVVAGAIFLHQNFDEMRSDQSAAWNWLRGFMPLFKGHERMIWHDFLSTVFEESLPLCIAEKVGSTPDEVAKLRLLLTEDEAA